MKSLPQLNKLIFFISILIFDSTVSFAAVDIWEKKETNNNETKNELTIETPTFSDETDEIKINENKIEDFQQSVIGIIDPEENNFNLNMWSQTDGEDIKRTLKRINKLKLSKHSENLLFKILFTNAYPPKKNLSNEEFVKIKINWLIKKKRIKDLEILLQSNPEVGKNSKAVKFLINEYLSSANIKSACNKVNFLDKNLQNDYLNKFTIYCLINNDRKEEAQLVLELLKERGFKDDFFENKINYLLGILETTNQKILDNNLLNFYLSHITHANFEYAPNDKTDKYIWKYLSSANLIKVDDFENKDLIIAYENAASENAFDDDEIFKIYLRMNFSFNQLVNAQEIYKNLANYKARALIYQSILLTDDAKKKIDLALLLKKLFVQDKLLSVYAEELSNILTSIEPEQIPENYIDTVQDNLNKNFSTKIKFDNDILHRSKVIKHFLDSNKKISRTEKDFKTVYKKIKKNKKYFMSIKDIVVLESLASDGVSLPGDLDYSSLSSELTVPENLKELVKKKSNWFSNA